VTVPGDADEWLSSLLPSSPLNRAVSIAVGCPDDFGGDTRIDASLLGDRVGRTSTVHIHAEITLVTLELVTHVLTVGSIVTAPPVGNALSVVTRELVNSACSSTDEGSITTTRRRTALDAGLQERIWFRFRDALTLVQCVATSPI